MALNFRALYRWMLPGNYTADESDGGKVLYSLSAVIDSFDQMMRDRLTARFPTKAGESALALIGADRGIPRGRAELAEHYANRLIAWRYPRGHRVRGSAFALLEQISEYFGGGFELHTVQHNLLVFRRDADGSESTDVAASWDWDSADTADWADKWARFWVVIDGSGLITETPDYGDADLYGGQHGDSSYAVGHDGVSADDVNAIRRLFRGRAWKPAGTRAMWAVVTFDGSEPAPDGTWGRWAKDDGTGNYVSTRPGTYRYWALDPTALLYGGDPELFPASADMPGGGTEAGDPTSFPVSSTEPGGFVYGGNPARFPVSARLVDDGSIP